MEPHAPSPPSPPPPPRPRGAEAGDPWFGQVQAFVRYEVGGERHEAAFVRWYEDEAQTEATARLGMRLKWCKTQRGGKTVDYTDLVPLAHILEPVFLQTDPTTRPPMLPRFFWNHFVR